MILEIAGGISLVKAALECTTTLAKGFKGKPEQQEALQKLRASLTDLEEKLIGARAHCYELEEDNRKLRAELEKKAEWKTVAEHWELTETADGLHTYKMKSPTEAQAKLRACPHCFQNGKISVFQRPYQNDHRRVCHTCGFQFSVVLNESMVAYGSQQRLKF